MSYTVLARKYRSQTLGDLVGQEAIATTLTNAILSNRVHHGYLFTGTRGVGKTSTARVLAKSLNCMSFDAPTPTPCCECESCRMIAEGEDIDVIEIDAASNTGVDNIRDLRDNTAYRPARARYKVYIIDEVHMLSTGAFNALLKTLEEPPGHVKFILATTEIQKVPATIVSRCQRFDFRSISPDSISGHLNSILKSEDIEPDQTVIRRVARLANGSMRDALSLLDQLLSFGSGKLSPEVLDDVLPPAHDEIVTTLFDRVAGGEAAGALECVERSLASGQTVERFCELSVQHLRTLMLLNVCGPDTELVDLPSTIRDCLVKQSKRFDASTLVYMISLVEEVRRAVKSSSASRALIDAAVVRLAMATNFSDVQRLIARLDEQTDSGTQTAPNSAAGQPSGPVKASQPAVKRKAKSPAGATKGTPSAQQPDINSADEARARKHPTVQRAMDLFDGTLVSVEKTETPSPGDQPDSGLTEQHTHDAADEPADDGA